MSTHDQRVLNYIAQLRDTGLGQDAIVERLQRMQADNWNELPPLPHEWNGAGDSVSVEIAASRATEMVQSAVLQKELQHVRQALQQAEEKVIALEQRLSSVTEEKDDLSGEKHKLELEVSEYRGKVSQLEAELKAYGMAYSLGGEKPVSLVWIVLATAVIAAVIVIAAFVVAILAT